MKILDFCEDERPREKMAHAGAPSLSNSELIAVLLRTGSGDKNAIDVAQNLMKDADGHLTKLFNMSSESLGSVFGIGPAKVCAIEATAELAKRFLEEHTAMEKRPIVVARQVYDRFIPTLKGVQHEECWVLYLNTNNYPIGKERATVGGSCSTVIDPKGIVRRAIEKGADALILVHNHPTGNPKPSSADIAETERIKKVAEACSLRFLDHIIIADDSFFSFADERVYSA